MEICLMIEGQEGVTWEQWLALARACEDHGVSGLFRSDHYVSFDAPEERGGLDAWATLAALAAVTDRIRLGTMVSPVTFRHPSMLARQVTTVDHVSGGRVELGIGAGWFEREHRAFGFPFPSDRERIEMLTEQVEIVHRLWDRAGGSVTFEGSHYRLDAGVALPRPVQEPHPPLVLGGGAGVRAAALAARWADEYNVVYAGPDDARAARARLSTACEAIGRDPASLRFSVMTGAVVGVDRRELERRATALIAREGRSDEVSAFIEERRADHLIGTVEDVMERLREYGRIGVERVLLQHLVHDDVGMVELIGREVVPAASSL